MLPCRTDSNHVFFKYPNYVLFEEDKKMECLWQLQRFQHKKRNMPVLTTSEGRVLSIWLETSSVVITQ
jgi:hypothetical protein